MHEVGKIKKLTIKYCYTKRFVFFGTASLFVERISSSETEANWEAILFLFTCSKVNSTLLITSELADQHA